VSSPTYLRRLEGLPQNSPQSRTDRAVHSQRRTQPVPTSARSPARIPGSENAPVDPQVPGVSTAKLTTEENDKITIDVKQTSKCVQCSTCRLEERISCASAARNSVVGARRIDLVKSGLTRRSSMPFAPDKIEQASQKREIIRSHSRRNTDAERSTAHSVPPRPDTIRLVGGCQSVIGSPFID